MNPTTGRGFIAESIPRGWSLVFCFITLMAAMVLVVPQAFAAKGGIPGKPDNVGPPTTKAKVAGPFSTVSGTVTNNYGVPLAGADITFTALTASFTTTTDSSGTYTIKVPAGGTYDVSFSADNHATYSVTGSVIKGKNNTLNAVLTADARVIVNASVSDSAVPDAVLNATGSYIILDGSTFVSSNWSQNPDEGVPATIDDPSMLDTTVTLGSVSDYAAHLIQLLKEPPITEADLPPDLNLQPINEINKGLQDRNQVVAIDPFAYERAEEVPLKLSVTTTSGTYSGNANVVTHLPWVVNTGVKTVPVGVPVLLYAKDDSEGPYSWTISMMPNGSSAALTDADTQTPWFTPDVVGTYEIVETGSGSGADLMVHVGRYHGVIDPILTLDSVNFGDGRPVADPNCTACHNDVIAPDNFATWRNTGHAEAFYLNSAASNHFGENCIACHAVGFHQDNAGGIDNTPSYTATLNLMASVYAAPPEGVPPSLYPNIWPIQEPDDPNQPTMLENYQDTARMANVQCENCHGPQSYTEAHPYDSDGSVDSRVKLGSEVCGSCHGEPARHGRYQQWLLSNHADYELAGDRGLSGNCGRCHSGNGFVAWSKLHFDPAQQVVVTWNADTVVPQTCAACHNPHDTGTTSGSDETNARVRVNGYTGGTCGNDERCDTYELLAGFTATNVGKGATCMTCHNSRADVPRNDATWASLSTSQKTGSPHHGVQADLVMGQNQYFTGNVPTPGAHATIEDVCVTCHMDATQPPDILSYNQAGTNHTFAADPGICVECHGLAGETLADNVDAQITGYLGTLETQLGAAWERLMQANYPITGACSADGVSSFITDVQWVYHRGTRLLISVDGVDCGGEINPSDVDGNGTSLQDLALAANTDALYKAAWNYGLNYEDETINGCVDADDPNCDPPHTHRGVHNHAFSQQGLLGAIAAVQEVLQ